MTTAEETLDAAPATGDQDPPRRAPGARDVTQWAFLAVVVVDVVVGTYYRFTTSSKMWLDEVQTVNISSVPARSIPHLLRLDGAPPLYYELLHFWMGAVGRSDAAIRSLSGLFAMLCLPVIWWVVRRGFGGTEGLAALAVFASSPFAVYYATEARMYSLVMLLVAAGMGALIVLLERATLPRAAVLAVLAALLLYTHYWSFYLLFTVGVWLCWVAVRDDARRRAAIYGIGAMAAGGIAFLPWVPTFLYQRAHTGTPWSAAPSLASVYNWFGGFVYNQSVQNETLSLHIELGLLTFIGLLILGFAAAPVGRDRLEFRLTGQPRARVLAFISVGTLGVGWVASRAAGTAFQPRYSSVVFPVLVVIVALGIAALPRGWVRVGVLAVASFASLWTVHWGAHAQRTQAGKVAVVMHHVVPAGSLVVVCPDQLGPTLLRYAGTTRYHYVGFPRFTTPHIVNWVDYQRVVNTTSLPAFADRVTALAGDKPFYLVWSVGYGFHKVCTNFAGELIRASHRHPKAFVVAQKYVYYQSMNLLEFAPKK